MDVRGWRIAVHRAARAGLAYAGWEAADRDGARRGGRAAARRGCRRVDAGRRRARRARRLGAACASPIPGATRTRCSAARSTTSTASSCRPRASRASSPRTGWGTSCSACPTATRAEEFYTRALGLRVTDRMDMGGGHRAVFLRASPRHHSLALTDVLPEPGLHHFMLETRTLEDVGRAWDRVQDQRVPIQMTLGQHANDPLVSFYVATPGGFGLELGWNGMLDRREPLGGARVRRQGRDLGPPRRGDGRDQRRPARRRARSGLRICILGAGGLGSLVGGWLAESGVPVTLVGARAARRGDPRARARDPRHPRRVHRAAPARGGRRRRRRRAASSTT